MEAAIKVQDQSDDLTRQMHVLGQQARIAARELAVASTEAKNVALRAMAAALRTAQDDLLSANAKDIAAAKDAGRPDAFIDRLALDGTRVEAMAKGLEDIAALSDPVGEVIASWERPNGLHISRVRTPLGVIGIIFESRPNVTADAGALCLKAGNAAILRPGSESFHSSRAIMACLAQGLRQAGLPETAIQIVPTRDRAAVGLLLQGLGGAVDVIVPRGGKSLVERVQTDARVPVFAHLEGICHIYVDGSADPDMARDVTLNAKLRRTGICGAAETLLVESAAANSHLVPLIQALLDAGCEVRGDRAAQEVDERVKPATPEDWSTEYLDKIISVKTVEDVGDAIDHISRYSSHHTESIITENLEAAARFFKEIDSAILLHNASTQFADGGEFGMGAEIGIATGKMHARGPIGVEQLTSFKYVVRGNGQIRP